MSMNLEFFWRLSALVTVIVVCRMVTSCVRATGFDIEFEEPKQAAVFQFDTIPDNPEPGQVLVFDGKDVVWDDPNFDLDDPSTWSELNYNGTADML